MVCPSYCARVASPQCRKDGRDECHQTHRSRHVHVLSYLQMQRVSICRCSLSTTGSADDSCRRCLFRCMCMCVLCGILRLYIPQLGDSSTAAMSLVIATCTPEVRDTSSKCNCFRRPPFLEKRP